jgi:hypothetical protein
MSITLSYLNEYLYSKYDNTLWNVITLLKSTFSLIFSIGMKTTHEFLMGESNRVKVKTFTWSMMMIMTLMINTKWWHCSSCCGVDPQLTPVTPVVFRMGAVSGWWHYDTWTPAKKDWGRIESHHFHHHTVLDFLDLTTPRRTMPRIR